MRTFSALTLTATLLAGSIATASAADLRFKAPAPAPAPVPIGYDWTGYYVGAGGAWVSGDSRWRFLNAPAADTFVNPSFDQSMVSIHGGMLHQFKGMNIGGFGLVVGLDHSAAIPVDNASGVATCPNVFFNCTAKIESLFTTGGIVGLAWDRFLISARGGWAGGSVRTNTFTVATGTQFDQTSWWHNGWYVGGAVDWAFYKTAGSSWILGFEYQHVDLGGRNHFNTAAEVVVPFVTRNVDVTTDVFKVKLTAKLDGPPMFFW